jgi:myo-inositol-1(or 4)-monophosphatase
MLAAIEQAACAFIREAGKLVLARYGGPLDVAYKGKGKADPVTEVDRAVEAYLAEAVAARFPHHAVLGEEGKEQGEDPGHEFEWIVDPLDGTLNFINRLPFFAVSIGVLHQRRPVVGALLFPVGGELLHARHGGGAFRDGQPLRVGAAEEPHPALLAGLPPGFWFQFKAGRAVRRKLGEPRSLGSIAYEMGLVATGAFHTAIFRAPKIWDVAGGVTIVREAGGVALRYSARQKSWHPIDRFIAPPPRAPDKPRALRAWGGPVLVGAPAIVRVIAPHLAPRYAPVALKVAMKRYEGWRKRAQEAKEREERATAGQGDGGGPADAGVGEGAGG